MSLGSGSETGAYRKAPGKVQERSRKVGSGSETGASDASLTPIDWVPHETGLLSVSSLIID